MIMETLECTRGAYDAFTLRVAVAPARPAARSAWTELPLPTPRPLAGVGLDEVFDSGEDCGDRRTDAVCAGTGIDTTAFAIRLGPPPDSPPVY